MRSRCSTWRLKGLGPVLSAPAFWSAAAQRRTSSAVTRVETGRAATALLARRRPPSWRACGKAMGAVPGTFSQRKESQAPTVSATPRAIETAPIGASAASAAAIRPTNCPARPGGRPFPACPGAASALRGLGLGYGRCRCRCRCYSHGYGWSFTGGRSGRVSNAATNITAQTMAKAPA